MHDPLGDEMKALERASEGPAFPRDLPVYVRIDGRGFSKFTRGMDKPFDARMSRAMLATAEALVRATAARAGYVQSDEISLVFLPPEEGEHLFSGRSQKMASVLAGQATASFFAAIQTHGLSAFAARLPHFDARVVGLPDREAAAAMVAWRGQDARRNGINMIAQSAFPHRRLSGKGSREVREMLAAKGIEDPRDATVNGTLILPRTEMRSLSEAERLAIPEHSRPAPDHRFARRVLTRVTNLHPGQIENLEAVIFEGAEITRTVFAEA